MRRLLCAAALAAAMMYGGPASAGKEPPLNEATCFYECIESPGGAAATSWQEVTTLMVGTPLWTNPFGPFFVGGEPLADRPGPFPPEPSVNYTVTFVDGNERVLLQVSDFLSVGDLDEIHVCRTLQANGVPVPKVGVATVRAEFTSGDRPSRRIFNSQFSAVWIKDVLGRFNKTEDNVFSTANGQYVKSIGKTTCAQKPLRLFPRNAFNPVGEFPTGRAILIENTADGIIVD